MQIPTNSIQSYRLDKFRFRSRLTRAGLPADGVPIALSSGRLVQIAADAALREPDGAGDLLAAIAGAGHYENAPSERRRMRQRVLKLVRGQDSCIRRGLSSRQADALAGG